MSVIGSAGVTCQAPRLNNDFNIWSLVRGSLLPRVGYSRRHHRAPCNDQPMQYLHLLSIYALTCPHNILSFIYCNNYIFIL